MGELASWPALILAAGFGTRARPLTYHRAKAAFPVAGRAVVERQLDWLARSGLRHVVINLHHRPETITGIVGDGRQVGLRVRYSWEQELLGSAGGPARAFDLLDADRCLIINGDTLTDVDLEAVAGHHRATGALITLAVIPHPAPHRYGGVLLDADCVVGFTPPGASPLGMYHMVGVQAVERSAFVGVPIDRRSESIGDLYPRLIVSHPGSIRAYLASAWFRDVGTAADYLETSRDVARREGGRLLAEDVTMDPAAMVTESVVWDRVRIGRAARLRRSIVADGVEIPPASSFDECVIASAQEVPPEFGGARVGNLVITGLEPGRRGTWTIPGVTGFECQAGGGATRPERGA